jgi:hypothetical protein
VSDFLADVTMMTPVTVNYGIILAQVTSLRRVNRCVGLDDTADRSDGFDLDGSFGGPCLRARKGRPAYPPWVQVIIMGADEEPYETEVGVAFEGPGDHDTQLEGVDLALEHTAGENEALVRIAPDRDGKPDEERVLASFEVSGERDFSVRVENLRSRAAPVLHGGERYWILLSVALEGSEVALRLAPDDFAPQEVVFVQRFDKGEWGEVKSAIDPGCAIRVTGRAEARPAG